MKTPWISFQPQPQRLDYHNREGQKRSLEVQADGALEPSLQDRLEPGFVASLADPRLHGPKLDAGSLGPGWTYTYQGGERLRLGSPDGPHQILTATPSPEGGHQVELVTVNQGVEHQLEGLCRQGTVEESAERARLDVSPAGLDVLCDGKVLFQMPSAFTGGCSW